MPPEPGRRSDEGGLLFKGRGRRGSERLRRSTLGRFQRPEETVGFPTLVKSLLIKMAPVGAP